MLSGRPAYAVRLACLLSLGACSNAQREPRAKEPSAIVVAPAPVSDVGVPVADNVQDLVGARVVEVVGTRVTLDGVVAADLPDFRDARGGEAMRIDGLFEALQARHEPRPLRLRLDRRTKGIVVKSILQTVALAGYPNGAFEVRRRATAAGARIDFALLVPVSGGPPPASPNQSKTLHVYAVHVERFSLVWRQNDTVVETWDVPRSGRALAEKVASEWVRNGEHRSASDQAWDQAVVHVADEADLEEIVSVIDAVSAPNRELSIDGKKVRASSFQVVVDAAPLSR